MLAPTEIDLCVVISGHRRRLVSHLCNNCQPRECGYEILPPVKVTGYGIRIFMLDGKGTFVKTIEVNIKSWFYLLKDLHEGMTILDYVSACVCEIAFMLSTFVAISFGWENQWRETDELGKRGSISLSSPHPSSSGCNNILIWYVTFNCNLGHEWRDM